MISGHFHAHLIGLATEKLKYFGCLQIRMSRRQEADVVGKERVYITLPKDLLEQFEGYCERNGMKLSSRIAVLIRQDLERSARAS